MKKIAIILAFSCVFTKLQAQNNYVSNPGFEQKSGCPHFPDQIRLANNWSSIDSLSPDPLCSPEYCNECDTTDHFGAPNGIAYYHNTRSGKGMAQVLMFIDESYFEPYKRDYLQGRIKTPLVSGKSYCITFYATLTQWSEYAINHIGAYIDNGAIDNTDSLDCASPLTNIIPQIVEDTIINDTLNWVKIQGSYVAEGDEKFITIGNFYNKANTSYITLPYSTQVVAYYLIDDVSIIESDAKADGGDDTVKSNGEDSVWIGTHNEGMPSTWYVAGSATPIGYSGGMYVNPKVNTTYVMELDLMNNITYDTVNVIIDKTGFSNLHKLPSIILSPNPVKDVLRIENGNGSEVVIYDMLGQKRYAGLIKQDNEEIKMGQFSSGIYLVEVKGENGERSIFRIVKE